MMLLARSEPRTIPFSAVFRCFLATRHMQQSHAIIIAKAREKVIVIVVVVVVGG
jgi:hypothetical protein